MASLKLDGIYTDQMVVPVNKLFKISGQAISNSIVSLEIYNQNHSTIASENGSWMIEVDPLPAKIETNLKINNQNENIDIKNVRTGMVLLLTGQSNIEFKFRDDSEYQEQIESVDFDNVYFYNVPQLEYQDDELTLPEDLETSVWEVADKTTLWKMSDIGYWMVKKLHELNPNQVIGVIDCYKGGTSASSWVSEEVLQNDQNLISKYIKPFEKATTGKIQSDYDREFTEYNNLVVKHNSDLSKFMKENPKISLSDAKDHVGHTPWPPPMTPTSYLRPNGLYHTMIEKVKNYSFDKVIWYQGENDAGNPNLYGKLLEGLIKGWRKLFNDRSLPFYVIQLPGYVDEPKDAWAIIRQHQLEVSEELNDVHLISISDTGEKHNIHPTHKRIAGTRIGEIVSDIRYDASPTVYNYQSIDNKIYLFVNKVSALVQRGKVEFDVNVNGLWITREVMIEGHMLILNKTEGIQKIRYAFTNYPRCSVFNEFGAPLAPFEMEIG